MAGISHVLALVLALFVIPVTAWTQTPDQAIDPQDGAIVATAQVSGFDLRDLSPGLQQDIARIAGGVASTVHYADFAGSVPQYFRLKRTGNTWTLRTSSDGELWTLSATFTEALNVTAIGPYAGNSGSNPPAFTSRVDYFRDVPPDLTPPAISAIASQPTGVGATVTWTTDEPSTSEIVYGPTAAYESGGVNRDTLVRSHPSVGPGGSRAAGDDRPSRLPRTRPGDRRDAHESTSFAVRRR